jgi:hypothetical protein
MRLPVIVLASIALLTACRPDRSLPPQSGDALLMQKLVGAWSFGDTNSFPSGTTIIRPNGTYITHTASTNRVGRVSIGGMEGKFYVSNGVVFCTMTMTGYASGTMASAAPARVVRVDDRELVLADPAGHETVARRISP